jgi:menaquinone-9 beta-reductase
VIADVADVAIVGGGPAGAITAMLLARAGHAVVLLERSPEWRWRACGVFTSPAAVTALRRVGLTDADLESVARAIPAMRVETRTGTAFRLTYGGTGALRDSAVGIGRGTVDALLLEMARTAGVDVRVGTHVERVELEPLLGEPSASQHLIVGDGRGEIAARIVVGADGLRSVVARAAGVDRRSPLGPRVGLTFHLPDPMGDAAHDARLVVIDDGYVGLAPVPGGRVNVGIVLGRSWSDELRRDGGAAIARGIVERLAPDGPTALEWAVQDSVAGVSPLGHRVVRRGGDGWILVGDAAGFLDPFTGEGLHRAIVSAELGAAAVGSSLADGNSRALFAYDRAMASAFGAKDRVSRIVQAFLGRPPVFDYAARRLASRPDLRETMGLVMGDLAPAGQALDPRYLAALLRP